MKISQKLEYACRVLIQLASSYDGERVSRVDDLAQKESVSSSFLLQILNELRKAGIVASKRGKLGGYMLARAPKEITLHQVVEALEGNLIDSNISIDGESGRIVREVWSKVSTSIDEKLHEVDFESLIAKSDANMFHI